MHAFSGQVHTLSQVPGNSDVGGEPLREDGDGIFSPVMAIHLPPFQGGQDKGNMDGGIVPKDLEASNYLVHGPKVILDLPGASGDITTAVGQHLLLLSLSFLQMPLQGLTSMLSFFLLSLLTVGGFISGRDKNFFLSWLALAPATPTTMSVFASALPHQFFTFPGRNLGMLIQVQWCRIEPFGYGWHPSASRISAAPSSEG